MKASHSDEDLLEDPNNIGKKWKWNEIVKAWEETALNRKLWSSVGRQLKEIHIVHYGVVSGFERIILSLL